MTDRDRMQPGKIYLRLSIKQNKMINPKLYLVYLFLACYTLFNIFLLKLKKIDSAHYLIDIKNSKDFYDFRSKEVLEISPPQTSANFMHLNNEKKIIYWSLILTVIFLVILFFMPTLWDNNIADSETTVLFDNPGGREHLEKSPH